MNDIVACESPAAPNSPAKSGTSRNQPNTTTFCSSLLGRGLECVHAKTSGTCQKLYWERDRLWTFLDGPNAEADSIEPTNNASERSLRAAVIKRKLSFGIQSTAGSRFIETLLTVIETCRQQGRNALTYVTNAMSTGQPQSLLHGV